MTPSARAKNCQLAMAIVLSATCLLRAQEPSPAPASGKPLIPAESHPWAKFPPGSWARNRITKETYDARGVATTSAEEIRTILKATSGASYTLTVERSVNVGNRQFVLEAHEQTFGLSGEKDQEKVESVTTLGDSELVINGRKIPCEVRQAVMNGEGAKRTTLKVFYSADVTPHALRREWSVGQTPQAPAATTVEEVISVGLPYPVAGQLRAAAFVHTLQKLASQTKESMEVTCDEVPGGIVAQWSKELDADGKLVRRTTQELIDFGVRQPSTVIVPMRRQDRKRNRRGDEPLGPRHER
jgi:hypothetical protein